MVDDAALTGEKAEVWLRRPAAAMMRVEVLNFILILVGWLLFVKRLCCIELIIVQSDVWIFYIKKYPRRCWTSQRKDLASSSVFSS